MPLVPPRTRMVAPVSVMTPPPSADTPARLLELPEVFARLIVAPVATIWPPPVARRPNWPVAAPAPEVVFTVLPLKLMKPPSRAAAPMLLAAERLTVMPSAMIRLPGLRVVAAAARGGDVHRGARWHGAGRAVDNQGRRTRLGERIRCAGRCRQHSQDRRHDAAGHASSLSAGQPHVVLHNTGWRTKQRRIVGTTSGAFAGQSGHCLDAAAHEGIPSCAECRTRDLSSSIRPLPCRRLDNKNLEDSQG